MIMRLAFTSAILLLGCGGAARPATLQQLQHRATFDLACSPLQLQLVSVDERTKAVSGCGRWAVYVQQCETIEDSVVCSWLVDGPTHDPPAPCASTTQAIRMPSPSFSTEVPATPIAPVPLQEALLRDRR